MKEIYLDNAATTELYPEVIETISQTLKENYHNPSALYKPAIEAENIIRESRKQIADLLNFRSDEIFFTSGATEANNTIIRGVVEKTRGKRNIIASPIEHPSVRNVLEHYREKGIEIRYIPITPDGELDYNWLEDNIDEETILVTVMGVNNEIGSINDLVRIRKIIDQSEYSPILHTDFVQAFLKSNDKRIDLKKARPDAISITAHKIHGPKGIGAIGIRKSVNIPPLLLGGGQESGFRSGTEDVASISGFEKAIEIGKENKEKTIGYIRNLKNELIEGLKSIEGVHINSPEDSVENIISISIDGIKSEVLIHMLELDHIFVSAGSACSNRKKVNHVHEALGYSRQKEEETIRISFSENNTSDDIQNLISSLKKNVKSIRGITKK